MTRRSLDSTLVLLVCLIALALGSGGCQTSKTATVSHASSRLENILSSGVLRVGLTANQPPLNMRNKAGDIVGLEVDIVMALTGSMKLEPRFVTMPFAELLSALQRKEVDIVISGVTITPERNARVAFAGPYMITGKSILTKSATLARVTDATVLDNPNARYAALAGSTSEDFVKDILPKAQLFATPDYDTAVAMVIDDKVDALIADYPICALSVWRNPDIDLSTLMPPFTAEPLGIALPADAPLLVNLVENYLDTLEHTGLLTQFKAKWLRDGDWVDELP